MQLDRKYVIAAGILAFVSWAYLTDWIPSLRWIPHAFVAGVITTLVLLLIVTLTTSRGIVYRGHEYAMCAPVAPAFVSAKAWEEEKAALESRAEYRRPMIFPEAVAFSKAIDELLDLVIKDRITSWYGGISKRALFQHEVDRCIRSVLLTIAARMTNHDLVEIGVANMLPLLTVHLKDFYEAERAVRGKDLSHNVTESEELNMAIAGKYNGGKLHPVASMVNTDTTSSQQLYFRSLVAKLLPIVLPDNMKSSPAVLVLIREIVACAVLTPVFGLLLDPDIWNQLIVNLGGPMLQDRKAVRKVRAALEQNSPVATKAARSVQFPRLRAYDTERQFERFIRGIRHISTLSDARKLRSEIMSQIRRDSSVDGQDAVYIRRLETGKRLLDQKISTLSEDGSTKPKLSVDPSNVNSESAARKRRASLREVLYDASGLSYFMEFMDRLNLMRLVQFYIVVDGFRGPLEGDHDDLDANFANESDRMDIGQMYENYLSKAELQASEAALSKVRAYLKGSADAAGPTAYLAARQAVLQTQTQVYNMMRDTHYGDFKRSDLYHKWLAIEEHPALAAIQSKQVGSPLASDIPRSRDGSPVRQRKPQLLAANKAPELRRAVLSSTNLKDNGQLVGIEANGRRSLDEGSNRPALFDDDVDDDRMTQSLTSLRSYESDQETAQQARDEAKAVDAMKMALDGIVHEDDGDLVFGDLTDRQSLDGGPAKQDTGQAKAEASIRTVQSGRPTLASAPSDGSKPSIASLGLVGGPSSRGVFIDDLFGAEAQNFAEDEKEDSAGSDHTDEDSVQEAAPGDLGLTEAIDVLNADIEKLTAQRQIVDSLTAKAELTNNAAELRILRKSEQSLQREIRRKEMQKQQYVVQESDSSLYGRAAVSIKSVMIGKEDDGHEFALYVIEIKRQAGEQMAAATWVVTRRYSQFHELHKRLRARFPSVRQLDFPKRQALFTLQKDFVQKRRVTLERYLRSLLLVPAICSSRELRAFLSQSSIVSNGSDGTQVDAKDFVSRIYNSVSDGMEEFLGNIPVLDQLSVAGQNLISAATSQMSGTPTAAIDHLDPAAQDPATAAEAEAELNAYETKEVEPFVKPICDLFLETFELSKGNSWLRGRTVVVVLHQLLGGTIERKVREAVQNATEDESLVRYVDWLKNTMWPDGKPRTTPPPRTPAERARTKKEASLILGALIPDVAGSVVGKANAQAAGRKIIAALNNQRLNIHLIFTVIDEVMRILFPETMEK